MAAKPDAHVAKMQETLHKFFVLCTKQNDVSKLDAILADNFAQTHGPNSAQMPPKINREGFKQHVSQMFMVLKDPASVLEEETWPNPTMNQIVKRRRADMIWHDHVMDGDAEDWRCVMEFMYVFTLDESGEKIVSLFEFVDTKAAEKAMALVTRAFGNLAKSQ